MGRPPGRVQDIQFQMRVSEDFLRAVDAWREAQPDIPSRAKAIRHLVELGLAIPTKPRKSPAARAEELAAKALDKRLPADTPPAERAKRTKRLLKPGL